MVIKIVLTGIGHQVPDEKIDNSFFDEIGIDSSSKWIKEKTGICNRYSVLKKTDILLLSQGKTNHLELQRSGKIKPMVSMALEPWKKVVHRANKEGDKIFEPDLLLSGTSVPDYDIPANACTIGASLGFRGTCAFDVNSACSSFLVDLEVSAAMMRSQETFTSSAIFNLERYSTRLDYSDRKSCILFGDGGTAALLEKGDFNRGLELIDSQLYSDVSGYSHVTIPVSGTFRQEGRIVQKFAISRSCEVSTQIVERNGLSFSDISYFIGHQANLRMLQSVVNKLNLKEEQHLYNVDTFGNQGAAGAPSVLSQNWEKFKKDDFILLTVVGSGLTWGAALFRCLS